MMQLNPYLNFPGNCEEAINFYKSVFGGEVEFYRFAEMPADAGMDKLPEEAKNKIMHAQYTFNGTTLLASDSIKELCAPDQAAPVAGTNFSLSLNFPDKTNMAKLFDALALGGKVGMPLEDSFWGAHFGMLTDKYGINWLFNCELNQAK